MINAINLRNAANGSFNLQDNDHVVSLPLEEIIDDWLEARGIFLEWDSEALVIENKRVELLLQFNKDALAGDSVTLKDFLENVEVDRDERT